MTDLTIDGYLLQQQFSDGRMVGITRLTFGRSRIVTWRNRITVEDSW